MYPLTGIYGAVSSFGGASLAVLRVTWRYYFGGSKNSAVFRLGGDDFGGIKKRNFTQYRSQPRIN